VHATGPPSQGALPARIDGKGSQHLVEQPHGRCPVQMHQIVYSTEF